MALVKANRVRETSTTTGTSTYALAGAEVGFRTFSTAVGNGNTCPYFAVMGANWEAGIGTVGAATLARTLVVSSSNGNNPVSWAAGTKQVALGIPASLIGMLEGGNDWFGNQVVRSATADVVLEARTDGDFTPRIAWRKATVGSHTAAHWQARAGTTGNWVLSYATTPVDRLIVEAAGNGNILPGTDNVQDLGNTTFRWMDLFMSGNLRLKAATTREIDIECTGDGATPTFRLRKNGTTADTGRDWEIHVNSDGFWTVYDNDTNAERICISVAGSLLPGADGTQNFGGTTARWNILFAQNGTINTSDGRQKEAVEDCELGLEFLELLRPVRFRWKGSSPEGAPHYGLIAQEMLAALDGRPFAGLMHDAETDHYGLIYSELVPVLIRGAQESSARVKALEQTVQELSARVKALEQAATPR